MAPMTAQVAADLRAEAKPADTLRHAYHDCQWHLPTQTALCGHQRPRQPGTRFHFGPGLCIVCADLAVASIESSNGADCIRCPAPKSAGQP